MKRISIALAGNANVGKSVIFNELTGLHQHIGNWPGKTVEKAEGTLHYKGSDIDVIDLPGIYSLSTYSLEEVIAREYITKEKPDVVINVIDASVLERNLYFTFQLMELGRPMVIALNQIDIAEKKGIHVDAGKLSKALGIPVVPTVAVKSMGMTTLIEASVKAAEDGIPPAPVNYGKEIEKAVSSVAGKMDSIVTGYPKRWLAIKLLEGDMEIKKLPFEKAVLSAVKKSSEEIRHLHKHPCSTAISCEMYARSGAISEAVQKRKKVSRSLDKRIDDLSVHKLWGYPIMAAVLLAMFFGIFSIGNTAAILMEGYLSMITAPLQSMFSGVAAGIVLGVVEGIVATLTVVIPYIIPFYAILGILESSGYLARVAFLMDNAMHRIGLHGKAFIPLMMGFGCNVPACLSCRVMETHRERLIAVFVTTLIPCAAVTTVILGLVGRFVSIWAALGLYVIDAVIVFALGRLAFKAFPGEPTGLIMEMPSLKVPQFRSIARDTWFKVEGFFRIAFPVIIASTVLIKIMDVMGMIAVISDVVSPVTVWWLGLPVMTGTLLIFGILRKELTIVMLAALAGTTNFAMVMTPVQMLVFGLVTMLYIPCASTIAALFREIGAKRAVYITIFEVAFAILIGGLFFRLLLLLGL
ncbi:MAG: ferrous iron transport protein B [Candidatus Aenigmarchaeota archaeon]|nr:ferrous iron transport protein B [Candidatus Aenigmarchaeota archaeon]